MIYEHVKWMIKVFSGILFPWVVKNYIMQLQQATKMTFYNQFDQNKTLNMSNEYCIILYVIQLNLFLSNSSNNLNI